ILPRNTRCVELGREVWSIENIVIGGSRLSIGVDTKIRSGFCPDVVGLGGMNAFTRIEIGRCIRNLRGVWMARRDETVDVRRGGVAENLPRTVRRVRLREVVILHRNHEDVASGGRLSRQQDAGHGASK